MNKYSTSNVSVGTQVNMDVNWQEQKVKMLKNSKNQEDINNHMRKRMAIMKETLEKQQIILDKYQKLVIEMAYDKSRGISRSSVIRSSNPTNDENDKHQVTKKPKLVLRKKHSRYLSLNTEDTQANDSPKPSICSSSAAGSIFNSPSGKYHDSGIPDRKMAKLKEQQPSFNNCESSTENNSCMSPSVTDIPPPPSKEINMLYDQNKENIAKGLKNMMPKPSSDKFHYREVVRNKDKRQALPGHECEQCSKYISALADGVIDKEKHLQACSRHRYAHREYHTPDDFWNLSFPDE